jgi:aryl-alcohol dehydrogenase-like predicted oxidoreductase
MLGKWFKRTGKRDEIFLASKFGIVMENLEFKGIISSGEYCKRACEASLKRLGTDSIDLCESLESTFQGCYRISIHS